MENEFFYEFNCIEGGEWIPEKVTLEDRLVENLRFIWNHRYNLERRYSQQVLKNSAARWRFKRQQRKERRRLVREIRAYRNNREFAPNLHQSLESWYLQKGKSRVDVAYIVNRLLTISWAGDPALFSNAETWERRLCSNTETQMPNRLKQLPKNVQKWVYEIAGMAGTSCPDWGSTEYNQATTAFLSATSEELHDFLFDHARYNLEHRISWHDAIQDVYRTPRQERVYREYLRSSEWQRKRQAVLNRAEFNSIRTTPPGYPIKPICERVKCSNVAEHVHHWDYERVGKEQIGMEPEASEENDLIALCRECHSSLHAKGKITG